MDGFASNGVSGVPWNTVRWNGGEWRGNCQMCVKRRWNEDIPHSFTNGGNIAYTIGNRLPCRMAHLVFMSLCRLGALVETDRYSIAIGNPRFDPKADYEKNGMRHEMNLFSPVKGFSVPVPRLARLVVWRRWAVRGHRSGFLTIFFHFSRFCSAKIPAECHLYNSGVPLPPKKQPALGKE
jgi:hypothetical protein